MALPSGQYTLRTACYDGLLEAFVSTWMAITINGDELTTTTAAPSAAAVAEVATFTG